MTDLIQRFNLWRQRTFGELKRNGQISIKAVLLTETSRHGGVMSDSPRHFVLMRVEKFCKTVEDRSQQHWILRRSNPRINGANAQSCSCQRATNLFLLHTCVKRRLLLGIWVDILLRYGWYFKRNFEVVRTKLIYENRIFQNGNFCVLKRNSISP